MKMTDEQIDAKTQAWSGVLEVPKARLVLCREYARAIEAEVLRINDEWIPVSEGMPEPDTGEVLVWLTGGRCAFDEWHMHREDPTGMGGPTMEMGLMWRDYDFDEITHWMRLPTAPGDHVGAAVNVEKNVPFEADTWGLDADGFKPELCTECGTPVRYGSRHLAAGKMCKPRPAPLDALTQWTTWGVLQRWICRHFSSGRHHERHHHNCRPHHHRRMLGAHLRSPRSGLGHGG